MEGNKGVPEDSQFESMSIPPECLVLISELYFAIDARVDAE